VKSLEAFGFHWVSRVSGIWRGMVMVFWWEAASGLSRKENSSILSIRFLLIRRRKLYLWSRA
jgi:hypothetical protein